MTKKYKMENRNAITGKFGAEGDPDDDGTTYHDTYDDAVAMVPEDMDEYGGGPEHHERGWEDVTGWRDEDSGDEWTLSRRTQLTEREINYCLKVLRDNLDDSCILPFDIEVYLRNDGTMAQYAYSGSPYSLPDGADCVLTRWKQGDYNWHDEFDSVDDVVEYQRDELKGIGEDPE